MREHAVERPRHVREVERLDEKRGVPDLPAAAAAHEPPQLVVGRARAPFRLLLQGLERPELTLALDDRLDARRAEHPDQLVLEVDLADVEPERLHVGPRETRAETCALERAPEVPFLAGVAEAREAQAEPFGAEPLERAADRLGASDREDLDTLGGEVPPAPARERLDRTLVAEPLDEDDRPGTSVAWLQPRPSSSAAGRRASTSPAW